MFRDRQKDEEKNRQNTLSPEYILEPGPERFSEDGREAEYGKNVLDRLIGASGLLLTETRSDFLYRQILGSHVSESAQSVSDFIGSVDVLKHNNILNLI